MLYYLENCKSLKRFIVSINGWSVGVLISPSHDAINKALVRKSFYSKAILVYFSVYDQKTNDVQNNGTRNKFHIIYIQRENFKVHKQGFLYNAALLI